MGRPSNSIVIAFYVPSLEGVRAIILDFMYKPPIFDRDGGRDAQVLYAFRVKLRGAGDALVFEGIRLGFGRVHCVMKLGEHKQRSDCQQAILDFS